MDYTVDFTPVDACAEAYVKLCFNKKTNNVYHLFNHHTCSLKALSRMYSFRIKEVSQYDFERKLKACKNDKDVAVLGFYNSMASVSRDVPVSSEFTVNELKKVEFKWPKPGLRYLCYMKKL